MARRHRRSPRRTELKRAFKNFSVQRGHRVERRWPWPAGPDSEPPYGTLGNLGSLPGYLNYGVYGYGIARTCRIVGESALPNQVHHTPARAFVWSRKSGFQILPDLSSAADSSAWNVNDKGTIIGISRNAANEQRAVAWRATSAGPLPTWAITDLSAATGERLMTAMGVSYKDEVVGGGIFAINPVTGIGGRTRGYYLRGAQVIELSALAHLSGPQDEFSAASGISVNGNYVVGVSYPDAAYHTDHAVLWTGDWRFLKASPPVQDLGALEGAPNDYSFALGVNSRGEVVGGSKYGGADRATIWERLKIYDLNTLIDPSDPLYGKVDLTGASDINDAGTIAATGILDGFQHGYLLLPKNPAASPPAGGC